MNTSQEMCWNGGFPITMAAMGISILMKNVILVSGACILLASTVLCSAHTETNFLDPVRNPEKLEPTVVIAVLVRNKGHTLPYFLNYIQQLNYPKSRITLW